LVPIALRVALSINAKKGVEKKALGEAAPQCGQSQGSPDIAIGRF